MVQRMKAAERRAAILAVAKVLFADRGYHGVSVDEIAARVAVSPAVLYRHFPSKQALYEAVLNEIACRRESYVETIVAGPDDFGSVLRRMTRLYVESVAADPDYLRMELHSVLEGSDAVRAFFENRWRPFADFIEFSVAEMKREGRLAGANGRVAALMFQGMVREALYSTCLHAPGRLADMPLPTLVDSLIDLFLAALGVEDRGT
ncbi:helix-turn-helix domain-containing protein [Thiohalobacter sp. IOR34]|uniref:TetR/AcrR family transcriptional regulator n=1 Tax=Thiohalobacter sp. IOR34 TaxID=3057176 RepID=UPI0025B0B223|nr:TetR/AcrR family transcriptional regulator [Thiohalobacter sp. IOR34]WJW75147.1 helix-turn-helix domain-containing protein [Thiohalobacter sp. IOR34]